MSDYIKQKNVSTVQIAGVLFISVADIIDLTKGTTAQWLSDQLSNILIKEQQTKATELAKE